MQHMELYHIIIKRRLINRLYKKYNNGFYVNAQRDLTKIKEAAKYIGRYLSRPAIAEYRISEYDGKNVTFWYENKNPKEKVTVKMDALDFIGKLVNHIHPKGFRVVDVMDYIQGEKMS